ncbi:MAG TPA: TIGR00374 family protein [Bacteroidetes bacterium]|nr:TIGR00374 family protein [Bacteroidota bacterium]
MFFSIALSVISMGLVIYFTWTPDGFHYIRLKRLPGIMIALVVALLRIWLSAAKMRYLADKELTWMGAIRVILTWDFASAITPSTIGGAPVATYAMKRENISLGKSGAITLYGVLLDQLFYVLVIPFLIIAGFYIEVIPEGLGFVGSGAMFLVYAILLAYAFVLAYGLLVNPNSLRRVAGFVFKLPFLNRLKDKVDSELDTLVSFSSKISSKPKSFLFNAFLISTLAWLAKIALPTIVVLSFLPANEFLSLMRSFAMNFAGFFVPTPGGSGGMEGLFVVFQGPLFDRTVFIGISVFVWRVLTYYLSIGLGMMVMTWYMKPINQELANFDEHSANAEANAADSNSPITR